MFDPRARFKSNRTTLRSLLLLGGFLAVIFVVFVQPQRLDLSLSKAECETLNQDWQNQYQAGFTYSSTWSSGVFECPSAESGLVRALRFLQKLEFQAPHEANFYQRLKRQSPVLDRDILFSRAGKASFEDRRITLNDRVLVDNDPVQIAGILLDEMRHLEEGKNTHVPCRREPSKMCDPSLLDDPQKGGAYNFNIYFLDLVRHHSNASTLHKKLARRDMQKIFETFFNSLPDNAAQRYQLGKPQWQSAGK